MENGYIFLVFLIGVSIVCITYYILLENSLVCSSYHFQNSVIPYLCKNPTPVVVVIELPSSGNENSFHASSLCKHLCLGSIDITCHTQHLNKAYVFTLNGKNQEFPKIVLKSVVTHDDADSQAYWKQKKTDGMHVIPTEEELKVMISSQIDLFLGVSIDKTLIQINSSLFKFPHQDLALHEELWKLVGDHEFLTSYLFHHHRLFPKLLGVCKNFYAVEYAHPLIPNPLISYDISWDIRIEKALDLVRLIKRFDSQWKEVIHLCDMKHDHFGWTRDNEVLFLDLDSVVTNSALKEIMINFPPCQSHADCSYFDCTGKCLSDGHCSTQRANSNLQTLCNKIFLGNSETSILTLFGLIANSNSKTLTEALHLCSTNPGVTTDIMISILETEFNSMFLKEKTEL